MQKKGVLKLISVYTVPKCVNSESLCLSKHDSSCSTETHTNLCKTPMKKIYNLTKYQEFYRMNKTYKKILSGFLQTSYNTVHN